MVYRALYRKYRPKNFNEVAGQKTVVQVLKNSILRNKISHAYLFYGPRGTGKTSIAKIFAKTVNCDNNNLGIACGTCSKCTINDNSEAVDIIEIDAASNNGVDEIRELKSKVNLVPSVMKYKVYIIDEVHMLSIGAFNALLKTLEEPPSHVIFILATTELNKVPNTIISRCQLFEFKKISDSDMFDSLKRVVELEKINIDDSAINEIIKYSDGGMRDSLSLLDKLSLYSNDIIDVEIVRRVCGNASLEDINELFSYIELCDAKNIVNKIDDLYFRGVDLINVANDLVDLLKNKIFDREKTNVCSMIIKLVDVVEKMKKSVSPRIIFEATILESISNDTPKNISREIFLNKEINEKEEKKVKNIDAENNNQLENDNILDLDEFKKIRINNVFVEADKNLLQGLKQKWELLGDYTFDSDYGAIASLLMDTVIVVANEKYMVLTSKYKSLSDKINFEYLKIQKFIEKFLNKKYKIVCITFDEWDEYKNEYIKKIKNKYKYKYIEDNFDDAFFEKQNNNYASSDFISVTEDLFGKENIVVK